MLKDINISPIFYMGCKRRLINKGLISLFPAEISTFVDVFGGSGIVSMNVQAENYILNDIDSNLYALYELFKTEEADVIIKHINARIEEYGLARERTKRNEYKDKDKIEEYKAAYKKLRDYYNNSEKDVKDFYTLLFYSFSQQFRFNKDGDFNMPCGNDCFTETNAGYIRKGCDFFGKSNLVLSNRDFREVLEEVKNKDNRTFVYLDPPYLGTTATYNENNGWNNKDEQDMYS